MIGSQISHYRVIRKLGEGGMGVVYEAEDLKLERRVALKFLSGDRVTSENGRRRFLREARSAAALNHPNICTVYEVDESAGQLFIAMEYCEGLSLKELIHRGSLNPAAAISIVIQVADALKEAHRRQIIHRDVKSSNIMVDAANRARLLDFGLAGLVTSGEDTVTLEFAGTPAYMAPERFELQVNDARGDIWALGVILYEAVSGKMPFSGGHTSIVRSILHDDPPPLSSLVADLAPELDEIVDKALAKDPAERYQSVDDLLADLIVVQREGRQAHSTASATARVAAAPAEQERVNAVAVLPFVNMSHHPEDEFLSDGLAEEIGNALTQVRGLRVVSRASTFQFKSPSLDLRDVGRRLRVGALVMGSVRRQAERVRVTAQLVKASNGHQLWSQRFDSEMKAMFDIEDQVTAAIVEHLRQWLKADLEVSGPRRKAVDSGAYELYLRGRHSFNLQTPAGVEDALRYFSQALTLEPAYAQAHVGIADCRALQGWYGIEPPEKVMPLATEHLDAAIAIDDALPSAWCLRAVITSGYHWNWEQARGEFHKAFSLGPATSDLRFHHALDFLTPLGRLEEALEEMKLTVSLDPTAPLLSTAVGGCLYRLRRYPSALRQLQSTLEFAPDFYHAHWSMAKVYQALGLFTQAMESFDRALARSGDNPAVVADAGHCRAAMGDVAAAAQIRKQLTGMPLPQSILSLGLKEMEATLEHLRQAVERRTRGLIWLGVDPRFDDLRGHPGFRSILAAVGLEASAR